MSLFGTSKPQVWRSWRDRAILLSCSRRRAGHAPSNLLGSCRVAAPAQSGPRPHWGWSRLVGRSALSLAPSGNPAPELALSTVVRGLTGRAPRAHPAPVLKGIGGAAVGVGLVISRGPPWGRASPAVTGNLPRVATPLSVGPPGPRSTFSGSPLSSPPTSTCTESTLL